jgi:hypothetical protein
VDHNADLLVLLRGAYPTCGAKCGPFGPVRGVRNHNVDQNVDPPGYGPGIYVPINVSFRYINQTYGEKILMISNDLAISLRTKLQFLYVSFLRSLFLLSYYVSLNQGNNILYFLANEITKTIS